ncbi:LuxR family transcriptional regulator [Aliiroseovarius halocynthiae]|uniref:LuxR family transcriptional regulator n=1 Tax=Aliiroseovarius halocynthiae TaxID=985055 RepID=A0A545SQY7_9RHOB|nr:LuxR family transcriptional regulator [Aliiroseovarius halocynthiae]TQV67381.1 LuxR family transcriptional regulator [Aliiroseovarius halocynthiae]SMR81315.1 LuxR family transcriptional regulator [Aliiroseovarius halocynthiae]
MQIDERALSPDPEIRKRDHLISVAFDEIRPEIEDLAPSGFSLLVNVSLRGYEHFECTYPISWQQEYEAKRYFVLDPILLWALFKTGDYRWSGVPIPDFRRFMRKAAEHGLKYGACFCRSSGHHHSLISVSRADREYTEMEMLRISEIATELFMKLSRGDLFTNAELQVLQCLAHDLNVKESAAKIGVSESAVKERLSTCRKKLGCRTNYHLVALAMKKNLIS